MCLKDPLQTNTSPKDEATTSVENHRVNTAMDHRRDQEMEISLVALRAMLANKDLELCSDISLCYATIARSPRLQKNLRR